MVDFSQLHQWDLMDRCLGCSPGCAHCVHRTGPGTFQWEALAAPLSYSDGDVLVCDKGDLGAGAVDLHAFYAALGVVLLCPTRQFYLCTKYTSVVAGRIGPLSHTGDGPFAFSPVATMVASALQGSPGVTTEQVQAVAAMEWPPANLWLGTSVESPDIAFPRLLALFSAPVAHRYVMAEPFGGLDLRAVYEEHKRRAGAYPVLDFVVIGADTHEGAEPLDETSAQALEAQCLDLGVTVWRR